MRNLAKLVLFFSLSFIIVLLAATVFRFLSLWIEWAKYLPPRPESTLSLIIASAHWALSLSLFSSIILGINYSIRRKYLPILAVPCIMLLSFVLCLGFSSILEQLRLVPSAQITGVQLGQKGLILSHTLNRNETAVILLGGTENPLGPRVTAFPDQPLVFQPSVNTAFQIPPVPFGGDIPWFLKSLSIDIRLNGELFHQKFREGLFPYIIYSASMIFLLCSLGYAVKFSVWPLANLFLAALALRGVLALGTFFNSPEMQDVMSSFLGAGLSSMAIPLFYLGFGLLINLYSLLVFAAKRRDDDDY